MCLPTYRLMFLVALSRNPAPILGLLLDHGVNDQPLGSDVSRQLPHELLLARRQVGGFGGIVGDALVDVLEHAVVASDRVGHVSDADAVVHLQAWFCGTRGETVGEG